MMWSQFRVYPAETYNFKMSEPDEFDEDDTFRYWQHQLEKRDPLGTMIIQGHLLEVLLHRSRCVVGGSAPKVSGPISVTSDAALDERTFLDALASQST
jgi:hypothetical protein